MKAKGLYVVATPIGNLGDLTTRARDVLAAVDVVLAEDTRRTRALLNHLGVIAKRVERCDAHTPPEVIESLVSRLADGQSMALVSDAGTPGVSDPGTAIVKAAILRQVPVVPVPGPSAVLAALVGSGLAAEGGFTFVGFLPRDGTARREAILRLADAPEVSLLFEAPSRVRATLTELASATPDRPACVARELTKIHEEFVRGTLTQLAADPREWLGEAVIVLGAHEPEARLARVDDSAIDARIDEELAAGAHAKAIAERLAAWSGRPKREIYERVTRRRR